MVKKSNTIANIKRIVDPCVVSILRCMSNEFGKLSQNLHQFFWNEYFLASKSQGQGRQVSALHLILMFVLVHLWWLNIVIIFTILSRVKNTIILFQVSMCMIYYNLLEEGNYMAELVNGIVLPLAIFWNNSKSIGNKNEVFFLE